MNKDRGILVVNRFDLMRRAQRSGGLSSRATLTGLPPEDVFRRYRGFDGLAWPEREHPGLQTLDGLADTADIAVVERYRTALPCCDEADVIRLVRGATSDDSVVAGWEFYGFDVGYFESEWSHFSVVLNEIIYGSQEGLRRFVRVLNTHLLLPSPERARDVVEEHEQLERAGADVERGNSIEIIGIYGRTPRN